MRFRITIRGEGVEVRGYVDGDMSDLELLASVAAPWQVIASPAPADFDPFRISEPDQPPTLEASQSVIESIFNDAPNDEFAHQMLATIHQMQAVVIRQERALREKAEAELRDRELHHFETEQENAQLKADHTESEKALIDTVNTQADEIERLAKQYTSPPPGWYIFGHHANRPDVPRLEFWGQDSGGMPIWERPITSEVPR